MGDNMKKNILLRCGTYLALMILLINAACNNNENKNVASKQANNVIKEVSKEDSTTIEAVDKEVFSKQEKEECKVSIESGKLTQSDCDTDLVCVPDIYENFNGHCRVACASEECPKGRSCQMLTTKNFTTIGAFCLPVQNKRDGQCHAPLDNNSCAKERTCLPINVSKNKKNQLVADRFLCRNTCPYGEINANDSCPLNENCLPSSIAKTGICGKAVRWATQNDIGRSFTGEVCNETEGHKFCNTELLKGLQNPAFTTCAASAKSKGNGFCLALCSTPDLDRNQDGKISQSETGSKLSCPVDYKCSTDLGRKFGLYQHISDAQNPAKHKECNLSLCDAKTPCPSQCGPGNAECLTTDDKNNLEIGVCGAPLGSCEPGN